MSLSPPMQAPPKTLATTPFLPSLYGSSRLTMPQPPRMSTHKLATASLLGADDLHRDAVLGAARGALHNCLSETHLDRTVPGLFSKIRGKVRDIYDEGDYLVLVTTDRQSAFDRVLASIPFKGQVLNETSLFWFNETRHITPNAVVSTPDKNVTIAKKCSVFPVEFVVRGFVTGSTDTSLWTVYSKGTRHYCGNVLPEGMVKNQKLTGNILTPTTKASDHDVPVTPEEVVSQATNKAVGPGCWGEWSPDLQQRNPGRDGSGSGRTRDSSYRATKLTGLMLIPTMQFLPIIKLGLMTQDEYEEVSNKALNLFAFGQQVALENGLLLVDTKYEFGKGADGTIMLIDEVHTPDSSRYWIANSYEERFNTGLEPENVDKEFLRLWFKDHCNPYEDEVLPAAPEELVCELAWRYIFLYERITNSSFQLPGTEEPVHDRISRNVSQALSNL